MRFDRLLRHAPAALRGFQLAMGRAPPSGKARRKPAPPKAKPAAKPKPKAPAKVQPKRKATRSLPPVGIVDAAGFLLAAGVILVWPRRGGNGWERAARTVRERGVAGAIASALASPAEPLIPGDAHTAARAEPDRGRDAKTPLHIPARGWRDILKRTWDEFNQDRIVATAGGVTFFTLLAMFPALAAFVSLYGLFFDVHEAREQLRLISGFVPKDIIAFIGDEMTRISAGGDGKLGFAFAVSLVLSLWSANGAVKALFDGLNVAYGERERRNIVTLNLLSLGFTFGALLFALLAIAAVVAAPAVMGFLRLDAGSRWLAELRWPLLLLVLGGGLSLVYRYGPCRQHPRWVWITPGGALAAVLWLAASLLFSFYVANFGSFNKTYGSLGAVVGFMTWLWYSTIIVLFGAELNAEIEHQTAVDTTTGAPRPMGDRGAAMADTLGVARPKKA